MKETMNLKVGRDEDRMAVQILADENHGLTMSGMVTDRIFKNGQLIAEYTDHNIVVNSFLKLVMALIKNKDGFTGASYWAIGSGADSWDDTPVEPTTIEERLTNEIGRVEIPASEIIFLTPGSMTESDVPTNIIQIKHLFGTDDCVGKWREFGIFGGDASETPNSGIMINKKHHAVITKTNEMTIERTMRFTLNLV